jgi:nuclear transport factor 2 (NTF2) superfamily protein
MPWNVDALVDGFTEDCVVRFGTLPPFRGREVLRTFFANRSGRQKNYRLTKQFRTLMADTITNSWEGSWEDTEIGLAMKGFGVEVWVMRDGRIAVWDAAFNVARSDQAMSVGDLLR